MPSRERKTFTRILPQQHPDAAQYVFSPQHISEPDEQDRSIARETCNAEIHSVWVISVHSRQAHS